MSIAADVDGRASFKRRAPSAQPLDPALRGAFSSQEGNERGQPFLDIVRRIIDKPHAAQ